MSDNENSTKVDLKLSSGKMEAVSRTSALMAGFAMVAMVELSLPETVGAVNEFLLIAFVVCTTALVVVHLLALMTVTYLLPIIDAAIHSQKTNEAQKKLLMVTSNYVQVAWHCSTIVGIILFLIELCILCWVKFYSISLKAVIASICIIVPACIAFAVLYFRYRNLLARYRSDLYVTPVKTRDG